MKEHFKIGWIVISLLFSSLACQIGQVTIQNATPEVLELAASPTPPVNLPKPPATAASTVAPTPTSVPTAAPLAFPVVTAPALQTIHMLDAHNGWALSSQLILRTQDGGKTWYNVTMPEVTDVSAARWFVLDAQTAWVTLPSMDNPATLIYHTTDGGLSWAQSSLPSMGVWPQFLNTQDGFALIDLGAGAGSMAVGIYQTGDGGATWTEVFNNDPTLPGSGDSLPLSGMKNGLAFLDVQHAWVSGSRPEDGYIWLFASQDGGKTWQQQALPLPTGMESAMTSVDPPRFFNATQGILGMDIYASDKIYKAFYFTNDAGKTWKATPLVQNVQFYTFASPQDGWICDSSDVYVTHDGAQTWTKLAGAFAPGIAPAALDFVDANTGWALAAADTSSGIYQLYRTTDGGASWTLLAP